MLRSGPLKAYSGDWPYQLDRSITATSIALDLLQRWQMAYEQDELDLEHVPTKAEAVYLCLKRAMLSMERIYREPA